MATYKVIQDVEAEDKLIGPLTLRQFIYAIIAVVGAYICYFFATHGALFLMVPVLPFVAIAGFFAFPFTRDQPTEVWALAKVRFMVKPRRRIWDQSGVKELVTITVPKKININYTNGLSETEVKSRLQALADTIDSRGWVVKNAHLNLSSGRSLVGLTSDRLVGPTVAQQTDSLDIKAEDDILDEANNSHAKRLNDMISRKKNVASLTSQQEQGQANRPNNYWFLGQSNTTIPNDMVTFGAPQVVVPGSDDPGTGSGPVQATSSADDTSLIAELEARKRQLPGASYYGHMRGIVPISASNSAQKTVQNSVLNSPSAPVVASVTPQDQAAILNLAGNNDLDVATIARQANQTASQDDEVVVNLH